MKKELIRFFMRNRKHDVTLPFALAEQIMQSKDQLVMVYDENSKWTGLTINKAEIISTDHDFDEERYSVYNPNQITEPFSNKIDLSKYKPKQIQ